MVSVNLCCTYLRAWLLGSDISALGVDSMAGFGIATPPDSFLPLVGLAPPDTLFRKPFIFYLFIFLYEQTCNWVWLGTLIFKYTVRLHCFSTRFLSPDAIQCTETLATTRIFQRLWLRLAFKLTALDESQNRRCKPETLVTCWRLLYEFQYMFRKYVQSPTVVYVQSCD